MPSLIFSDSFISQIIEEIKEKKVSLSLIRDKGISISAFYCRARKLGYSRNENKINPHPRQTNAPKYADAFIRRVKKEITKSGKSYKTFEKYKIVPATYYYRARKLKVS